ncbi:MAG: trypsin-like peptidase domain-containing protein [Candidatus Nealsonbacteria bacterium]|nr:trypsin-like peptidase domain-containing protein [Candidatus Nealsonbacteria bacterium]
MIIAVIVWISSNSSSPNLAKETDLPGYVALVIIETKYGDRVIPGFYATGFLVDKDKGLVATAAHIVETWLVEAKNNTSPQYRVFLQGRNYLAKSYENAIDWKSDTAILFLENYNPNDLPDPAKFSETVFVGQQLSVFGYALIKTHSNGVIKSYYNITIPEEIVPTTIESRVNKTGARQEDLSILSSLKIMALQLENKSGTAIPREKLLLFFNDYILTTPTSGFSGAPLTNSEGQVVAMHSSSVGLIGLEIPSQFIISLLRYQQK